VHVVHSSSFFFFRVCVYRYGEVSSGNKNSTLCVMRIAVLLLTETNKRTHTHIYIYIYI
jgi:hypothetical protein